MWRWLWAPSVVTPVLKGAQEERSGGRSAGCRIESSLELAISELHHGNVRG